MTTAIFLAALVLLIFGQFVASTPLAKCGRDLKSKSVLPLAVNTIHQGGVPTWYENLAVRGNNQLADQILLTRLDSPVLEQVTPSSPTLITINVFPSAYKGCTGITETSKDVFYVSVLAPFDSNFAKISGNSSVFKVDMNTFNINQNGIITSNATITKVVDLPEAGILNGMATLDARAGLILIADSLNGWVYRLNVNTGVYSIAINDDKMKALLTASTKLGVNGIKIRNGYLYWTNTGSAKFSRIQINQSGQPIGTSAVVGTVQHADDFIFSDDGLVWVAQNQAESLSVIQNGQTTLVAGNPNSTTLAGVTAAQFGRSGGTKKILYLTTNGGLSAPVNGTVIVGGKLAYVDTSLYDDYEQFAWTSWEKRGFARIVG